jgi:hypothetical protein
MSLENGESPPTAEPTAQEPRRSRAMTAAPTSGCLLHPQVSAAEYGTGRRGLRAPRPARSKDPLNPLPSPDGESGPPACRLGG